MKDRNLSRSLISASQRMRKLSVLLLALASTAFTDRALAANPRYSAPKPVFVKLLFDGDASFPSLTVFSDTTGLARFTGSAFGLNAQQRLDVINRIRELLEEDYRPFNVRFVVVGTPPAPYYSWGIDDTALVAPFGTCEAPLNSFFRIYGKAGGRGEARDCRNNSIAHPRHARTWAGSFALPPGSRAPSQPPLGIGGPLQGTTVNVEHIAQALANSAAHEIGHLFQLWHPNACEGACPAERLMHSASEALEAKHNKVFNEDEQSILREVIGLRPFLSPVGPYAVRDTGTGLIWSSDARLVKRVAVRGVVASNDGALDYDSARAYASRLDYFGYNDWRLPSALNPDQQDDCHDAIGIGRRCFGSDLSHLTLDLIHFLDSPSDRFRDYDSTRSYWSTTSSPVQPRIFTFGFWSNASPDISAHVWPVRGAATLIDNGDGTVTDTARRLVWKKTPLSVQATAAEAVRAAQDLVFAGSSSWRLPRLESLSDATCDDSSVFASGGIETSAGCARSELGHLFHGWGVSAGSGSTPLELDEAGAPVWLEPDDFFAFLFTYSFAGGVMRSATGGTRAQVFPVRALLPNEVSPQRNVNVDPHPNVVVRFRQVTARGVVNARERFESAGIFGSRRVYELDTRATFDAAPGAVEVCLRYDDDDDFPFGQFYPESDIRVGRQSATGAFVPLPLVSGYPDTTRDVVCGSTDRLGRFAVLDGGR